MVNPATPSSARPAPPKSALAPRTAPRWEPSTFSSNPNAKLICAPPWMSTSASDLKRASSSLHKEISMAAVIPRSTFNPAKHYSGVRQQQGRVSLDADWNEQVDIAAHRVVIETADVIGRTGGPRDNAAFQMVRLPQQGRSSEIAFSPGRMYVDGFLCELESTAVTIVISGNAQAQLVQLSSMIVDDREFAVGQWVEISAKDPAAPAPLLAQVQAVHVDAKTLTLAANIGGFAGKSGLQLRRITTYLTQPDSPSPAPLPTTGFALAYLDVWQRAITAIEDSEIREPALG